MKTLLIFIMITFVGAAIISTKAQSNTDSLSQHLNYKTMAKDYLKKSHDQRKVSSIMFIGGGAMAVTGVILAAASFKGFFDPNVPDKDYGSAPDILGIGGMVIMAAGVPIAIASHSNKKKARLSMNKESVFILPGTKSATSFTAIALKLNF